MESNPRQVGRKHKSEEYQCHYCGKWAVFEPFDAKGRFNFCPDCQYEHRGLIARIKELTEEQWAWIVIQIIITYGFIRSNGDGNGANWARAIIFNLAVAFLIYAVRRVWPEKK